MCGDFFVTARMEERRARCSAHIVVPALAGKASVVTPRKLRTIGRAFSRLKPLLLKANRAVLLSAVRHTRQHAEHFIQQVRAQ